MKPLAGNPLANLLAAFCTAALCAACGGGGGGGAVGAGAPTVSARVPTLSLVAGVPMDANTIYVGGFADGDGAAARFNNPAAIAADTDGNLYVADRSNCAIRKISAAGHVSTLAGSPQHCSTLDGGPDVAGFAFLTALTVSPDGTLYATDGLAVREITQAGQVRTIATLDTATVMNSSLTPYDDMYFFGSGIAVDGFANVVVANTVGIRKIAPAGAVTILDGVARLDSNAGVLGSQSFNKRGLAAARDGTVYVGELDSTVSRIDTAGKKMTLAGLSGAPGYADGVAGAARFGQVVALTLDAAGNLYAADAGNNLVRKITPDRTVSTVAGTRGATSVQLGNAPGALPALAGLTSDGKGNLYAISGNAVVKITLP